MNAWALLTGAPSRPAEPASGAASRRSRRSTRRAVPPYCPTGLRAASGAPEPLGDQSLLSTSIEATEAGRMKRSSTSAQSPADSALLKHVISSRAAATASSRSE